MTRPSSIRDHYPLAIIGGGLTGKMVALALSHSGYDSALIAPKAPAIKQADRRSTTIHHAGAKMLDALGLTDTLSDKLAPIHVIRVAVGAQKPMQSDWLLNWSDPHEVMAYVVENQALDDALDDALDQAIAKASAEPDHGHINMIDDQVTAFEDGDSAACLTTDKHGILTARLVIACDGVKSPMRQLAGITPYREETGQSALIANLSCALDHQDTAYQRFLPTGPIALMPLADKSVSLVWSTSTKEAQSYLEMTDNDAIEDAIQNAFGDELGKLRLATPLSSFPLRPHYNRHLFKGRVILAGDAAHAIHPLAGMGYNLALADAAILLDVIQKAKASGLAPDHPSIKTSYRNRRMPEIVALSALTSQLNKLLSKEKGPLPALLAMGMSVVDKTPLKRSFMKVAKGGKLSQAPLLDGRLR